MPGEGKGGRDEAVGVHDVCGYRPVVGVAFLLNNIHLQGGGGGA